MASRDISPILVKVRQFLTGRNGMNPLRFAKDMAPRPGPEANLPPGVSHKLAANYYYTRDGRRSVELPLIVASSQKVIASGQEVGSQVPETVKKSKTPGPFYHYSMPQHH